MALNSYSSIHLAVDFLANHVQTYQARVEASRPHGNSTSLPKMRQV